MCTMKTGHDKRDRSMIKILRTKNGTHFVTNREISLRGVCGLQCEWISWLSITHDSVENGDNFLMLCYVFDDRCFGVGIRNLVQYIR